MDDLIDLIMELVPDVITDFFTETCFGWIKKRVENRLLRGVYYILVTLVVTIFAVGIAFAVASLVALFF